METKVNNQWSIINDLARIFEDNNIQYHFDGSTSVFVHGIEFDMDDIDIVFPIESIDDIRKLFKEHNPTEIEYVQNIGLKHFCFYIGDEKVHCLFYEGSSYDFSEQDVKLVRDNIIIWAKNLDFYLKHAKKDNILVPHIKELMNKL